MEHRTKHDDVILFFVSGLAENHDIDTFGLCLW